MSTLKIVNFFNCKLFWDKFLCYDSQGVAQSCPEVPCTLHLASPNEYLTEPQYIDQTKKLTVIRFCWLRHSGDSDSTSFHMQFKNLSFVRQDPPLEGGEENDTNSTKLESRTGDLEGKKREVRCIQITFDPSQLNWFFPRIFYQGKTWYLRTTWQQRRERWPGCIKSERWA